MIGRRLYRWRWLLRLPWRLARRRSGRAPLRVLLKLCGPRKGAICARRGALASASVALAARAPFRGAFSALMAGVAACSRALVPPGLRRRRPPWPPRRRPWAWSRPCRGVGWRCGGSRAHWPPMRRPSGRLGRWPRSLVRPRDGLTHGFPPDFAPAARLRALSLARLDAPGWRWGGALLLCFASGRSPSPAAPAGRSPLPLVVLPLRGRTQAEI